jgi:hypothetical protein
MSKPLSVSFALWAAFFTGMTCPLTQASDELLPPAPAGKQWKLIWNDEFDGDKLDESKWNRLGDSKRRDGFWTLALRGIDPPLLTETDPAEAG